MDYFRPKTYPSPPETYSACEYLGGALLLVALIVTLVVLAVIEGAKRIASLARSGT